MDVGRVEGQRPLEAGERLGATAEGCKQVAAIGERVDVIGQDGEDGIVGRVRPLEISERDERFGLVEQGGGVIGPDHQHLLVARQCVAVTSKTRQHHAPVIAGLGIAGPQLDQPVVRHERFRRPGERGENAAQGRRGFRCIGLDLHCRFDQRQGLRRLPLL